MKIGARSLLGSVKSSRASFFVPIQLSPEICFCTPPKAFCKWCLTHPVPALFPGFTVSHPGDGVQGIAELPVKHSVSYWRRLLMSVRKYHHSHDQSLLHHMVWRKCASFLARAEKANPYTTVWLSHCQGWTSALQLIIQPLKTSCEQPRALAWLGSCICFVPEWEITLSKGDVCRLAGSISVPAACVQQHMDLPGFASLGFSVPYLLKRIAPVMSYDEESRQRLLISLHLPCCRNMFLCLSLLSGSVHLCWSGRDRKLKVLWLGWLVCLFVCLKNQHVFSKH